MPGGGSGGGSDSVVQTTRLINVPYVTESEQTMYCERSDLFIETPIPKDKTITFLGSSESISDLHSALSHFHRKMESSEESLHISDVTYIPQEEESWLVIPTDPPLEDGYSLVLRLRGHIFEHPKLPFFFTDWWLMVIENRLIPSQDN